MDYPEWLRRQIAVHRAGVYKQLGRLMAAQEQLRLRLPGDTRRNRCARVGRAVREIERHGAALRMLEAR